MPFPPFAESRRCAKEDLENLYLKFSVDSCFDNDDECPWANLSLDAFERVSPEGGEEGELERETPLDKVRFNPTTRRYETMMDEEFQSHEDDFILQAMVMLILYRLDRGVGRQRAAMQLSIWSNEKHPSKSVLPNLWKDEMMMRCGKQAAHPDNFDSFHGCYYCPDNNNNNNCSSTWRRRSHSKRRSALHELAEQSAVQ